MWAPQSDKWGVGYKHYKQYINKYKAKDVSIRYVDDNGYSLGAWVATQRAERKKGKISQDRIKQLDELGFYWRDIGYHDKLWNDTFEKLKEFKVDNGHIELPFEYETNEGLKLYIWTQTQRRKRKEKTLSLERINKLDSLGFVWNAK